MDKTCPHCGAALPGEASFCPHCGESLHRRRNARMPRRVPARLLRALALLCLAVLLSAAAFFYLSPKVYEEAGEVSYTDADGTYQLVSNVSTDRFYPMPEIAQDAGEQESYRFPLRLYISHRDSGADASGIFLQKAIKNYFSNKDMNVTVKYIDPSYIVRSVPANTNDRVYCGLLGRNAVHAAMAGKTNMVVARLLDRFVHLPLQLVTRRRRQIDIKSNYWRSVIATTGQRLA